MTSALLEDILRLSVEERVELIDEIWESIAANPDAIPVTPAQRDELDRRLETRGTDPNAGKPWREVIARLKKQE